MNNWPPDDKDEAYVRVIAYPDVVEAVADSIVKDVFPDLQLIEKSQRLFCRRRSEHHDKARVYLKFKIINRSERWTKKEKH